MKKIASFTVNHDTLTKGMYISRVDGDVVTYDIRMKLPNGDDYLTTGAAHTFEHLFATYARNSSYGDDIVYVGPMGCRTGFYLLVRDVAPVRVSEIVMDVLSKIKDHDGEMFGATKKECGNYRELDVNEAKREAEAFLQVLKEADITFEYPL